MNDQWMTFRDELISKAEGYRAAHQRNAALAAIFLDVYPRTRTRVRAADCNTSGAIGPARCLELLEQAHAEQWLTGYGVDLSAETRRSGAWLRIADARIAIARPLRAMEEIVVRGSVLGSDETSVRWEGAVLDSRGKAVKALAWMDAVWTEVVTGRPVPWPGPISKLLARLYVGSVAQFSDRPKQVEGEIRQ